MQNIKGGLRLNENNSPNPADKESLEKKIEVWLKKEGYPLEFYTERLFRDSGFLTYPSFFEADPETGKLREIDLIASKIKYLPRSNENQDSQAIRISFLVECKRSIDNPWVVFTSNEKLALSSDCITNSFSSDSGSFALWSLQDISSLNALETFQLPNEVGYGGRKILFEKGEKGERGDIFYETVQSIIAKAKTTSVSHNLPMSMGVPVQKHFENVDIIFPILVIDAHLFKACLGQDDNLKITRTRDARLLWRGSKYSAGTFAVLDIITKDHLQDYIKKRISDIEVIFRDVNELITRVNSVIEQKNLDILQSCLPDESWEKRPKHILYIEMLNWLNNSR
jgi:hypothetical protein